MRKRTLLALLLFLGLALFSRWLVERQTGTDSGVTASDRSDIDYELTNFTAREFDTRGRLQYALSAPGMTRIAASGVTEVTQPRLLWPRKKDSDRMVMTADHAFISGDQNEIRLRGRVLLKAHSEDGSLSTIRSEELDYNHAEGLLGSAVLVEISAPGVKLQSLGMRGRLDEKQVYLLSQVKGRYESP